MQATVSVAKTTAVQVQYLAWRLRLASSVTSRVTCVSTLPKTAVKDAENAIFLRSTNRLQVVLPVEEAASSARCLATGMPVFRAQAIGSLD